MTNDLVSSSWKKGASSAWRQLFVVLLLLSSSIIGLSRAVRLDSSFSLSIDSDIPCRNQQLNIWNWKETKENLRFFISMSFCPSNFNESSAWSLVNLSVYALIWIDEEREETEHTNWSGWLRERRRRIQYWFNWSNGWFHWFELHQYHVRWIHFSSTDSWHLETGWDGFRLFLSLFSLSTDEEGKRWRPDTIWARAFAALEHISFSSFWVQLIDVNYRCHNCRSNVQQGEEFDETTIDSFVKENIGRTLFDWHFACQMINVDQS